MIYTLGHTESYERYFKEQDQSEKKGRCDGFPGGSVWNSIAEAKQHCPDGSGYSIYGVLADWETETEPTKEVGGDWHDLLVDAPLVRLDKVTYMTEETQHKNADLFSVFEATAIALYESNQLTPETLDAIAAPWRGYEMPETGELAASDGCTIDEIVVGVIMGTTDDDWGNYLKIRRERWGWK